MAYTKADSEAYWKNFKPYAGKVSFASGRSKTLENVAVPVLAVVVLYLLLSKPPQKP